MKRKIFLILIGYIFCWTCLKAQSWDWAIKTGNSLSDEAHSIGVDKQSNVYVTGSDYNFSGGGASNGSYYNEWLFKFDPAGQLLWKTQLDITVTKSVTDSTGNTYITAGNFIEKYDNNGTKLWTVYQPAYFQSIGLHPDQGVFVAGRIIVNNVSTGILISLDNNGSKVWEKIGDFSSGGSIPFALATDEKNYLYVAGDGDKDSTTGNLGFLAKYDKAGNLIYIRSIPHTPTSIAIDKQNNIYLFGWFAIMPININGIVYSSPQGKRKAYLLKYDSNNQVEWFKFFGGQNGLAGNMVADKNNKLYLSNLFDSSMTIDSVSLTSVGTDGYVINFDEDGNLIWIKNSVGAAGAYGAITTPKTIALNNMNEVFIAGSLAGNVSFDSFNFSHQSMYQDMFVAKISDNNITSINDIKISEIASDANLNIYPNPSRGDFVLNYSSEDKSDLVISIIDNKGQVIYYEHYASFGGNLIKNIDLSRKAGGIYNIEILNGKKKIVKRIVLN
ncbi:MAG: hypothetical protein K0S26_1104 [Bacteroidota bacterium]|jgi:hypothetical protein|nr:hypothetical protein [Bacteroidota bacterium]